MRDWDVRDPTGTALGLTVCRKFSTSSQRAKAASRQDESATMDLFVNKNGIVLFVIPRGAIIIFKARAEENRSGALTLLDLAAHLESGQ